MDQLQSGNLTGLVQICVSTVLEVSMKRYLVNFLLILSFQYNLQFKEAPIKLFSETGRHKRNIGVCDEFILNYETPLQNKF
jgi:hypothetical protein